MNNGDKGKQEAFDTSLEEVISSDGGIHQNIPAQLDAREGRMDAP